jgi:hypothetical protein
MQFTTAANTLGMHSECIRNALEEEKRQAKEAANVAAKNSRGCESAIGDSECTIKTETKARANAKSI